LVGFSSLRHLGRDNNAIETLSQRLIIVNKHVEQVIESSINYTPQRFIEIYSLLARAKRKVKTGASPCHNSPGKIR
jgi:hypothetical protein